MEVKKIELITDKRNRQTDVDLMDYFRDGYSTDLDSPKTSGVLYDTVQVVNGLIDIIADLQTQINEFKKQKKNKKEGGV